MQTKDLNEKVRQITRQFKSKAQAIESANGEMVTSIKDVVDVWTEYCKFLLSDISKSVNQLSVVQQCIGDREPDILRDEVRVAVKCLNSNKVESVDGNPNF